MSSKHLYLCVFKRPTALISSIAIFRADSCETRRGYSNRVHKPRQRVVDTEQQHRWPLRFDKNGILHDLAKAIMPGLVSGVGHADDDLSKVR
jgi:hypothetical protein